jgi:hypothetical protein
MIRKTLVVCHWLILKRRQLLTSVLHLVHDICYALNVHFLKVFYWLFLVHKFHLDGLFHSLLISLLNIFPLHYLVDHI